MMQENMPNVEMGLECCAQLPPLSPEGAIDLVLGMSAHDSSAPAQQEFGKYLYASFFERLLDTHKNDPAASAYLMEVFASLSAAVRGFAVARRLFAASRKVAADARNLERQFADRLLHYSPLSGTSLFGKVASGISGGGLLGIIAAAIWSGRLEVIGLAAAIGISIGVIGMDYLLHALREHRYRKIQIRYPEFSHVEWQRETVSQYRALIAAFAETCLRVEARYYPAAAAARPALSRDYVQSIVAAHFPLAAPVDAVASRDSSLREEESDGTGSTEKGAR